MTTDSTAERDSVVVTHTDAFVLDCCSMVLRIRAQNRRPIPYTRKDDVMAQLSLAGVGEPRDYEFNYITTDKTQAELTFGYETDFWGGEARTAALRAIETLTLRKGIVVKVKVRYGWKRYCSTLFGGRSMAFTSSCLCKNVHTLKSDIVAFLHHSQDADGGESFETFKKRRELFCQDSMFLSNPITAKRRIPKAPPMRLREMTPEKRKAMIEIKREQAKKEAKDKLKLEKARAKFEAEKAEEKEEEEKVQSPASSVGSSSSSGLPVLAKADCSKASPRSQLASATGSRAIKPLARRSTSAEKMPPRMIPPIDTLHDTRHRTAVSFGSPLMGTTTTTSSSAIQRSETAPLPGSIRRTARRSAATTRVSPDSSERRRRSDAKRIVPPRMIRTEEKEKVSFRKKVLRPRVIGTKPNSIGGSHVEAFARVSSAPAAASSVTSAPILVTKSKRAPPRTRTMPTVPRAMATATAMGTPPVGALSAVGTATGSGLLGLPQQQLLLHSQIKAQRQLQTDATTAAALMSSSASASSPSRYFTPSKQMYSQMFQAQKLMSRAAAERRSHSVLQTFAPLTLSSVTRSRSGIRSGALFPHLTMTPPFGASAAVAAKPRRAPAAASRSPYQMRTTPVATATPFSPLSSSSVTYTPPPASTSSSVASPGFLRGPRQWQGGEWKNPTTGPLQHPLGVRTVKETHTGHTLVYGWYEPVSAAELNELCYSYGTDDGCAHSGKCNWRHWDRTRKCDMKTNWRPKGFRFADSTGKRVKEDSSCRKLAANQTDLKLKLKLEERRKQSKRIQDAVRSKGSKGTRFRKKTTATPTMTSTTTTTPGFKRKLAADGADIKWKSDGIGAALDSESKKVSTPTKSGAMSSSPMKSAADEKELFEVNTLKTSSSASGSGGAKLVEDTKEEARDEDIDVDGIKGELEKWRVLRANQRGFLEKVKGWKQPPKGMDALIGGTVVAIEVKMAELASRLNS